MQAKVLYVEITEAQRFKINTEGWNSDIGLAYSKAKFDKIDTTNQHLLVHAATLEAKTAEEVWMQLQNLQTSWADSPAIQCHTSFPRSMDVGDVIVWSDGTVERCNTVGFTTYDCDDPVAEVVLRKVSPELVPGAMQLNIIARKPRDNQNDYVVIKRNDRFHPYVSATANKHTLSLGEWFWGHYFKTEAEAMEHFNNR